MRGWTFVRAPLVVIYPLSQILNHLCQHSGIRALFLKASYCPLHELVHAVEIREGQIHEP